MHSSNYQITNAKQASGSGCTSGTSGCAAWSIRWERPRIGGNSQQHASASKKAYEMHCWRIYWTTQLQSGQNNKNLFGIPWLGIEFKHLCNSHCSDGELKSTQLLYRKGWVAEGGLQISVEPTLLAWSFKGCWTEIYLHFNWVFQQQKPWSFNFQRSWQKQKRWPWAMHLLIAPLHHIQKNPREWLFRTDVHQSWYGIHLSSK